MGALVETTLVAYYFPGVEGGTTPGRRLCGMAVETAPAKVLGLLAGCVVGELDGQCSTGGGGEEGGVVVMGLEGVGWKAELGGDDEGGVLELDRLGVTGEAVWAVGDGAAVDGVLFIVLVLWEVMADVGEGGATRDCVWVDVLLLLVMVPFGVVSAVVDVNV